MSDLRPSSSEPGSPASPDAAPGEPTEPTGAGEATTESRAADEGAASATGSDGSAGAPASDDVASAMAAAAAAATEEPPATEEEPAGAPADSGETVEAEEEAPARLAAPTSASTRARMRSEARTRALARFAAAIGRDGEARAAALGEAFDRGVHALFLGRFRRETTGGIDERRMLDARADWKAMLEEEERRAELRELLSSRGALTDDLAARLDKAESVPAMEDLAAPWLPVTASRATVARGHGLQPLADAIRGAKEASALSEMAAPFVKEGTEVAGFDAALAGARDIIAEAFCLDVALRARLRAMFRREAILSVAVRADRKGDPGRHGGLVGLAAPAGKVPPLKLLAIRRGERERVLAVTCEPPESRALEIVHEVANAAFGAEHPHAGFLRAAAEDGYRRILKPLLQAEVRTELKARADAAAMETFERTLKNLLLGPVGGPRRTLGIRADVTAGHRVAAVDEAGRPVHAGRLPHEATAGRDAAVAALKDLLEAHAVDVVVVGSGGGRREAMALAADAVAAAGREILVTEVLDGGTRALETAAIDKPVRTESGVEIGPEFVGALSLARRFQDPLVEYLRLDPRSLALGPNVHDVHQGRLRQRLDDLMAWCVTHVGPDATTAPAEVLAHVPGLDLGKARAFVTWRDAGGRLAGKAALGAVEGVGLAAAEQAVGFLRVSGTSDPRDRTQLHPEQYDLVDAMAAQVETDVVGLFREARLRARVDLNALARPDAPMPAWKHALWQATAGAADPRPRFAVPMKPPSDVTLETLRPGLVLEGRVIRAVPFGVFVDVGLPAEALIPLPHIGDRPGVDPAVVAPVGAVVQARVLEVDVVRRRVALSMRSDRDERRPGGFERRDGAHAGRGPRFDRGPRPDGPPRGDRGPMPVAAGAVGAPGAGPSPDARGPARPDDRRGGPPRGRGGDRGRTGGRAGEEAGPSGPGRRAGAPLRGSRGEGARERSRGRDEGRRFDRDDTSAPRRISLPQDTPTESAEAVDEANLTPEQLLARKLEEMKRRLARPE